MTGWLESHKSELNYRETAFTFLADNLPDAPVIVETGSLRSVGNVGGDGNSTLLWDELTAAAGQVYSIDIDSVCGDNIAEHCGKQVQFINGDSEKVLGELRSTLKRVDLLYIDSLDVDFEFDELAARHALREVQMAIPLLDKRSFVAVDDNNQFGRGKGRLVAQLAELKQWPLVVDGYVKVWSCDGGR